MTFNIPCFEKGMYTWWLIYSCACFAKMNDYIFFSVEWPYLGISAFLRMKMPLSWYNENVEAKCVYIEMHLKCFSLGEWC